MQTFFLITLFLFGTLFGSFASVIIHRIKSGERGILTGRSHCGSCNKLLQAIDLIPLFSWLINGGKCRQCKAKVSAIYPILELSTGLLFTCVGYFLIDYNLILIGDFEVVKLLFWLIIAFISIIYFFYDILFLEISERVLAAGVMVASIGIILQTYGGTIGGTTLIPSLPAHSKEIFGSGIYFSLLILPLVIGGLYTIILKGLSEWKDALILGSLWGLIILFASFYDSITQYAPIAASIGALSIFTFFFIQIVISGGKWMGQGDLRIAIFVGLLLGTSLAFPGMMLTYFSGSIIGIGMIVYQKITKKGNGEFNSQIPFGPFIAIGFFLAVFFNEPILNFLDRWLYL